MKLKVITVAALIVSACTSNDEQPDAAAQEPVAAESAELTEPAKSEPAPTDAAKTEEAQAPEGAPEATAAETKTDDVITEKSVSPGAEPTAAPAETKEESQGLYVAVSHLNVRSGPGMAHPVVDVINFNTRHVSLGTENLIWVKLGEGRYASSKYMTEQKPAAPMTVSVSQPETNVQPEMNEQQQEAAPAQEEQTPAQDPENGAPQESAPDAEAAPTDG